MRRPQQPHEKLEQELRDMEMRCILQGDNPADPKDETMKKRMRSIKNTLAAKKSREQARSYVKELEMKMELLEKRNLEVARHLAMVEAENEAMKHAYMHHMPRHHRYASGNRDDEGHYVFIPGKRRVVHNSFRGFAPYAATSSAWTLERTDPPSPASSASSAKSSPSISDHLRLKRAQPFEIPTFPHDAHPEAAASPQEEAFRPPQLEHDVNVETETDSVRGENGFCVVEAPADSDQLDSPPSLWSEDEAPPSASAACEELDECSHAFSARNECALDEIFDDFSPRDVLEGWGL